MDMTAKYVTLYELAKVEKVLAKHGVLSKLSEKDKTTLKIAISDAKKEEKQKNGAGNGVDKN
jgi:hypothetical protein